MSDFGQNYLDTLAEVRQKAESFGRNPDTITLVAVSKGVPLEAIRQVYNVGCRHFGESRLQDFFEKKDILPPDMIWHMLGTIQTKKAPKVIDEFALLHSVDTLKLAQKLNEKSQEVGIITPVLLQVNTSGEVAKHGLSPEECLEAWQEITQLQNLSIMGLMTMAPLVDNEKIIRSCFSHLRILKNKLREKPTPNAPLKHLSMGMSHDWEIALEEGATMLRIGTNIFS